MACGWACDWNGLACAGVPKALTEPKAFEVPPGVPAQDLPPFSIPKKCTQTFSIPQSSQNKTEGTCALNSQTFNCGQASLRGWENLPSKGPADGMDSAGDLWKGVPKAGEGVVGAAEGWDPNALTTCPNGVAGWKGWGAENEFAGGSIAGPPMDGGLLALDTACHADTGNVTMQMH